MDHNFIQEQRRKSAEDNFEQDGEMDDALDQFCDDRDHDDASADEDDPVEIEQKTEAKIVYPEPPKIDKVKFADEFDKFDPSYVADQMYQRKERKIPGSVLKPHAMYSCLV